MKFYTYHDMSRFRKGRFKGKKQSKLDQAFNTSKANKKKLSVAIETQSSGIVTATDVFNATPIVDFIAPAGSGFKTKLSSVQVKGTIKRDVASALIDDWRVDLVLDREPKGIEVTPLLVYGTATPTIAEYKNFNLKQRFKLLRSVSGLFGEGGTGVSGMIINWYVNLNLIAETGTENSFAQNAMTKNAIYLIYWTSAAANQPIPALKVRIMSIDQ